LHFLSTFVINSEWCLGATRRNRLDGNFKNHPMHVAEEGVPILSFFFLSMFVVNSETGNWCIGTARRNPWPSTRSSTKTSVSKNYPTFLPSLLPSFLLSRFFLGRFHCSSPCALLPT
jgi:hypothetical protein